MVDCDVVGVDSQVFARDLEAAQQRNIQWPHLHPAMETGGKALQQTRAQDWLRPGKQDFKGSDRNHSNHQGAEPYPKQCPMLLARHVKMP